VNRWQLKEQLVAAGVPEIGYFIVGIDSQQTQGKGGGFGELGLAPADDGQGRRIFTEERGRIQRERWFATEEEACEEFWQELKPLNRPIRQRTPQERERALERAREQIAEYRRAADEYRRGDGTCSSVNW
jgi:hypothetical protein